MANTKYSIDYEADVNWDPVVGLVKNSQVGINYTMPLSRNTDSLRRIVQWNIPSSLANGSTQAVSALNSSTMKNSERQTQQVGNGLTNLGLPFNDDPFSGGTTRPDYYQTGSTFNITNGFLDRNYVQAVIIPDRRLRVGWYILSKYNVRFATNPLDDVIRLNSETRQPIDVVVTFYNKQLNLHRSVYAFELMRVMNDGVESVFTFDLRNQVPVRQQVQPNAYSLNRAVNGSIPIPISMLEHILFTNAPDGLNPPELYEITTSSPNHMLIFELPVTSDVVEYVFNPETRVRRDMNGIRLHLRDVVIGNDSPSETAIFNVMNNIDTSEKLVFQKTVDEHFIEELLFAYGAYRLDG